MEGGESTWGMFANGDVGPEQMQKSLYGGLFLIGESTLSPPEKADRVIRTSAVVAGCSGFYVLLARWVIQCSDHRTCLSNGARGGV